MQQDYSLYTPEDYLVWKTLFSRQENNLRGKSCDLYLDCLKKQESVLNGAHPPRFDDLNSSLLAATGWSIQVVPGLIPVDQFFQFLAQKKFCSSTWVRTMAQLDYLDEPDMFHDIFGHTPMIIVPEYAQFMEHFGRLGVQYKNEPRAVKALQNLYWFTIEFGLINGQNGVECYGAGIASSYGETNHVFEDQVEIRPFNLKEVLDRDFINTEIQNTYYMLESFDQLYACLNGVESFFPETIES